MNNETKPKANDFTFNKWEIENDGNVYTLELDKSTLKSADQRYPVTELGKKGIVDQIEAMLHIFMMKNHRNTSMNVIKNIANSIIDEGATMDILPELQNEYLNAYEMVFTLEGTGQQKKISFKKI